MSESAGKKQKRKKKQWARLTVSSLEADVAYFDARLAMLDEKTGSYYQLAQAKAYTELEKVLNELLTRLRERPKRKKRAKALVSPPSATD
jgi:hypothetical protein